MLVSPLNYIGTKRKLIDQLLPLFPQDAPIFYDMFCGGCTVGMNYNSKYLILNDVCSPLIMMLCGMRDSGSGSLFMQKVETVLTEFDITPDNKDNWLRLRDTYNSGRRTAEVLYALFTQAYNSVLRFNSDGEFVEAFGGRKAYLNSQRKELTVTFIDTMISRNPRIYNLSFDKIPVHQKGFVYCDPPYLITSVYYNKAWGNSSEYMLYAFLDELNERGIKWGLSNVTHNKGKVNTILTNWMRRYNVHTLDMQYDAKFATGSDGKSTVEVYVCNY